MFLLWLLSAAACWEASAGAASTQPVAANPDARGLVWRPARNRLDARIDDWPLHRVLREIATATGWEVSVEPELQRQVSVRFKDLPLSDGLRSLLGEFHFALLPRASRPSALFIYRDSIDNATARIEPETGAKNSVVLPAGAIPNELVVTLKSGSNSSIEELAKRLGAKIVGQIDKSKTYRLRFEDQAAADEARQSLEAHEEASAVDYNYSVAPPGKLEPLAASSVPPLTLRAKAAAPGQGVIIGLIDTSVSPQGAGLEDFLLPAIALAGNSAAPATGLSHGTSMAQTVLRGLAAAAETSSPTSARILPIDVYGPNESTTTFDVARGIAAAAQNGARIINLSLGTDTPSAFLEKIIQDARKSGIVLVAAAGNEPVTSPTFPAAYAEVLAVTAGDRSGKIAAYANRGDFVDVIAPGANIVHHNQQTFLGMGTSFSSAYIAGAAAAIALSENGTAQIEAELRKRYGLRPATGK